jgi:murein peptide amidase A
MTPSGSTVARWLGPLVLGTLLACTLATDAAAKGLGITPARGVELPGSSYRYVTLNPGLDARMPTVVLRIEHDGGRIDRWWRLRGRYYLPATAFDLNGAGVSRDGGTLVLQRFTRAYPPRRSDFAVLNTTVHLRHPIRQGEERAPHAVRRIEVPGFHSLHALSPDGKTAYLNHHLPSRNSIAGFKLSALDLTSGRVVPEGVESNERMEGMPITQLVSPSRRWVYTLYAGDTYGNGGDPFLLALDTIKGELAKVDLSPPSSFLAFARTPRRPGNLLSRRGIIGRSSEGRPIALQQYGDPAWSGELLVFGCIHGDECGAGGIKPVSALSGGCPDPSADIHFVPNLNPDGAVAGSRLNGRGVDLNRNFPSEWRPFGSPWDLEYSGPKPSSEPETRLAQRIVTELRPEATIWFHQFRGERPFVRAWGQSIPAGRRFARLARMPFRAMRWPAGTAPNWQNHRFPGAASFVVELPRGELVQAMRERLSKAVVRMGRWVRED